MWTSVTFPNSFHTALHNLRTLFRFSTTGNVPAHARARARKGRIPRTNEDPSWIWATNSLIRRMHHEIAVRQSKGERFVTERYIKHSSRFAGYPLSFSDFHSHHRLSGWGCSPCCCCCLINAAVGGIYMLTLPCCLSLLSLWGSTSCSPSDFFWLRLTLMCF